MLEDKIVNLKKELIAFAGLVESMVDKSLAGIQKKDNALFDDVLGHDEPSANNFDIRLDEMCTTLIAQYQPRAKNLRIILMILKMSNDLERMGDHAVNIVESGQFLIARQPVKPLIDIPKMGELTTAMLRDAINAFINENATLAKSVCERDSLVDSIKDSIHDELVTIMRHDPDAVERSLHLLRISSNLERIADLSTNICEDVMFMVEGKVIKHHHEDEEKND